MSISSISGSGSLLDLFKRIDANSDGQVTKDEFLSARPKGVSANQASALFDSIDTSHTGSLNETAFSQGLANQPPPGDSANLQSNLSSDVMAALLQLAQSVGGSSSDSATASTASTGASTKQSRADALFNKIDTNGDGVISKDEFLAGRPKDMSSDQASTLYDKIANGSGSISKTQFAQAAGTHHHHHHGAGGPPPADSDNDTDASQNSTSVFSNQTSSIGLDQFLSIKPANVTTTAATDLFAALDTDHSGSLTASDFQSSTSTTTTTTNPTATTTANAATAAAAEAYLQQLLGATSAYNSTTTSAQLSSVLLSA